MCTPVQAQWLGQCVPMVKAHFGYVKATEKAELGYQRAIGRLRGTFRDPHPDLRSSAASSVEACEMEIEGCVDQNGLTPQQRGVLIDKCRREAEKAYAQETEGEGRGVASCHRPV